MLKASWCIAALFWVGLASAQSISNPVSWKMEISDVEGEEGRKEVHLKASIKDDWQLYSNDFNPDLGPMVTEFQYVVSQTYELVGGTIPQDSKRKYDDLWGGEYAYFEHKAHFIQQISTTTDSPELEVQISYQVCNTNDGKCIPFDVTLKND